MKPDTWMPFYFGDYLRDTLHLTTTEHGAYLLLMAAYWCNGGPIPSDDTTLKSITKCKEHEWARTKGVLAKFFKVEGETWRHGRIDEELDDAKRIHAEKIRASAAGVNAKRLKRLGQPVGKPPGKPDGEPKGQHLHPLSGTEIEPPRGFPRNEPEAKDSASFVGCPPDFAVKIWNKAASRGFTCSKGVQIRSWAHHLKTEWTYEQERNAKSQPAKANPSETKAQRDARILREAM